MKSTSFGAMVAVCLLQACSITDVPETRCQAAGAESVLGQTADARVVSEAIVGSGALRSRIVRPGSAVNLEVDPLRLNLEVDEVGRIRRLRCG